MAAVRVMGLASILLGLSLVDLASYEIPDGFIIAGIVWWAVCLPFMGGSIWSLVKDGLLGGLVIAGGMLAFSLLFDKITGKDSMGGGDIKLYFMVSLYLGLAQGFLNLILSCIVGLLFVLLLHRQKIPFGPSISISTLVCLMVGLPIVSWYFSLF
jgi:leader peptidase (prepilin peptidase)/N-methyltransferase